MLKTFTAAALLGIAAIVPASAAEMMTCDDTSMMKVQAMIDADKDPAMMEQTEMAKKELEMAKMAMKDSKMDDCSMHMDGAMKALEMKKSN